MEKNITNAPEIRPEEIQKKNEAIEQTPVKEGPTAGEKIGKSAGKVLKEGAKLTGDVAVAGVKAGSGLFGFLAANIKAVAIIAAVTAVATAVGFGVNAMVDVDKIKLMDTATVVTEIKKISEFTTYTYIDELIINEQKIEEKESKGFFGIGKKNSPDYFESEIVMIVSGVTRAGYDFGKITENDLRISGDTISINLPEVEIFDVIVNPSDTRMFVEEGKWSHEEVTAMQVNCRNQMRQNALERGILMKADQEGKEKVENLFKALGFKVVTVVAAPVPKVESVAPEVPEKVEETLTEVSVAQDADTTSVS